MEEQYWPNLYLPWRTPETECPVPTEQQHVNEYQSLSTSLPFSWASTDLSKYFSRLVATGATFVLFVGFTVSAFGTGTVTHHGADVLRYSISFVSAGLLAVTLAVLWMYLGWAYVDNRLL